MLQQTALSDEAIQDLVRRQMQAREDRLARERAQVDYSHWDHVSIRAVVSQMSEPLQEAGYFLSGERLARLSEPEWRVLLPNAMLRKSFRGRLLAALEASSLDDLVGFELEVNDEYSPQFYERAVVERVFAGALKVRFTELEGECAETVEVGQLRGRLSPVSYARLMERFARTRSLASLSSRQLRRCVEAMPACLQRAFYFDGRRLAGGHDEYWRVRVGEAALAGEFRRRLVDELARAGRAVQLRLGTSEWLRMEGSAATVTSPLKVVEFVAAQKGVKVARMTTSTGLELPSSSELPLSRLGLLPGRDWINIYTAVCAGSITSSEEV